jgi:glyoxylase-like metal-dependent hydrolase (beta-lactamase superfamily II)
MGAGADDAARAEGDHMADLLALSARIIDEGDLGEATNRITNELSEVADGLAVVESFSHSWALDTGDGLVVLDASGAVTGSAVVEAMRTWRTEPVHSLVYTHGHVDHVGGSGAFVADGRQRGHRDPEVVGHAAVQDRFDRYDRTNGWNLAVNARQFGGVKPLTGLGIGGGARFLPPDVARCTTTYTDRLGLRVGDTNLELRHGRGETDDHTWVWEPERRAIFAGDFFIWNFPNAGNPQKVQRYPAEWARALREMAALGPELLLPAHGLPIGGRERIAAVLDTVATTLERLVEQVVAMMNDGAVLDEIVHAVQVDDTTLALPYLRPLYDEPEFVVRNVWRQLGGWWDGNPARLKPPADATLAAEVAGLAGGPLELARRAAEVADAGDLRLACQLAEWAGDAAPEDPEVHEVRGRLYARRRKTEPSLMAKGIFSSAARSSAEVAPPDGG